MKKCNHDVIIHGLQADLNRAMGEISALDKAKGDLEEALAESDTEICALTVKLAAAERVCKEARDMVKLFKADLFNAHQTIAYQNGVISHMKENEVVHELGPTIEQPKVSRRGTDLPMIINTNGSEMFGTNYGEKRTEWWDR